MALAEVGPLEARLEALERNQLQWEAQIEAGALRAEGQFKSARASEERARTLRKHAESLAGGADGEEAGALDAVEQLLAANAAGGAPDEVPAVPTYVEFDPKAHARLAKWGQLNG